MKKSACFTDIHFGRKNNSDEHNQDCLDFINWFCSKVRADKEIDHIVFLGDWHEHRSSINGSTLSYSYKAALELNKLGLPVFFITGNHDMYLRNSREIISTIFINSINNINVISEPTVHENILFSPYLIETEYAELKGYNKIPIWYGHFEFKGFVVTGEHTVLDHGPDPSDFSKPKKIFSGHFHKRQISNNVYYIGNTFPMDYSDANDTARGFMTYEYENDKVSFFDWDVGPSYIKTKLSKMIDPKNKSLFRPKARIKCVADIDISFEETNALKELYTKKYNLRELTIEESSSDFDVEEMNEEESFEELSSLIPTLLTKIKSDSINNDKLIKLYRELK